MKNTSPRLLLVAVLFVPTVPALMAQAASLPIHVNETEGSAATLLRPDLDRDGTEDLLLLHPSGRLVAYRGLTGGFEPLLCETLSSMPLLRSVDGGDHDHDGILDLLATTRDGSVLLLLGDGAGGFIDGSREAGLAGLEGGLGARWSDVDMDGMAEIVLSTSDGFSIGRLLDGAFQFERLVVELPASVVSTEAPTPMPPLSVAGGRVESRGIGSRTLAGPGEGGLFGRGPQPGGGAGSTFLELPTNVLCAEGLDDPFSAACISASLEPNLGMLFPLTESLNVHRTGRVGVGTIVPQAQLDVVGDAEAVRAESATTVAGRFSTGAYDVPAVEGNTPFDAGIAGHFNGILDVGFRGPAPESANRSRVRISSFLERGAITVRNSAAQAAIALTSEEVGANGAEISLSAFDGTETIALDAEYGTSGSDGARVSLYSRSGNETVEISSQEATGNGAQIALSKANGIATIVLDAETSRGCEVSLRNSTGLETIEMVTEEVAGNGAQIILRKADGTTGITLDAEQGGDGRIITEILQITGGADLVESFDTGDVECPPGSVVVIDASRPGELTLSSRPYDSCVAGVVSGAGGVRPGLALGQAGVLDGSTQVALTGRVFVRCSTEAGPIRPGDLLTTSSSPGVAMRAGDAIRVNGAVLGKAMGSLDSGSGLVLVLVNLQ